MLPLMGREEDGVRQKGGGVDVGPRAGNGSKAEKGGQDTCGWTGGINQINSNILQVTNICDNIYSTFIMKYYLSRTTNEIVNKVKIVKEHLQLK